MDCTSSHQKGKCIYYVERNILGAWHVLVSDIHSSLTGASRTIFYSCYELYEVPPFVHQDFYQALLKGNSAELISSFVGERLRML